MDLEIAGKSAIVCAASKGLGKGSAMALAREGVHLTINARTAAELEATAQEIRDECGVTVNAVASDITTPEGRSKVLAACSEGDELRTLLAALRRLTRFTPINSLALRLEIADYFIAKEKYEV